MDVTQVYCGLLFIGIGLFGFYTVKHLAVTSLTPFMVLNIIACLFSGLLITLALIRYFAILSMSLSRMIRIYTSLIMIYTFLIRIFMFLIRIYMFDTVQEKGLAYRREDLKFLPTLNCTR